MFYANLARIFNMLSIRVLTVISIFIGITFSFSNIKENTRKPRSIQELKISLEDMLKDMSVPGMSIAIVNRQGPIWVSGLGKADLTSGRPATSTTLFRIGSVSKGFISLAILMLVEEGKISLQDCVKKLVPEVWFENKWEQTDPIRIVHLLENTTGWDDMHLREFAKDPLNMSTLDALNYDKSSRTSRWRPGTRMAYCNSGHAVAAYIVEKISGKKFEEFIDQKFFKPISMTTTTYSQTNNELATTLYHADGKTAYPYWNLLYPSIGSINASANDMANYLLFYLDKGKINGVQIMPENIFNRLEAPFSTWAAKEGLHVGYGLGNYCTIYDGFIYHGHDGNIPGGLSVMQYMYNEGIGYFYSINSDNRRAFDKIGTIIRAYITSQLKKPDIAPEVTLSDNVNIYAGWYEPASPRMNLSVFLERLFGLSYLYFKDNKLIINSFEQRNATFISVSETQFRYLPINENPDPIPTLILLSSNYEGRFIQRSLGLRNPALIHITMKKIPTWLAIIEIIITLLVLLALMSAFFYVLVLVFRIIGKRNICDAEYKIFFWPMIAILSLLSIILILMFSSDIGVAIERFGNFTIWSFSLFVATLIFAISSIASVITLIKSPKGYIRTIVLIYSIIITIALVISTLYLGYWGIIGLRTWI